MDYEKKYNEALKWMRELYPRFPGAFKEEIEHYFPELRESESDDERIRVRLTEVVLDIAGGWPFEKYGITKKEALAYLEKQKYAFENGRQLGIMQEQARRELEWDEQKEQKPAWSEEEIGHLYTLASYIKSKGYEDDGEFLEGVANKLKSLRPSWKPSKEQMEALMNGLRILPPGENNDILLSLYNDLKKL